MSDMCVWSSTHVASWKLLLCRIWVNPALLVGGKAAAAAAQSSEVPADGGLSGAGLFQRLWHALMFAYIWSIITSRIKWICVYNKVQSFDSRCPAFQNIAAHTMRSQTRKWRAPSSSSLVSRGWRLQERCCLLLVSPDILLNAFCSVKSYNYTLFITGTPSVTCIVVDFKFISSWKSKRLNCKLLFLQNLSYFLNIFHFSHGPDFKLRTWTMTCLSAVHRLNDCMHVKQTKTKD